MNVFEDQDVGILYLPTKFELDQNTKNKDLLLDRQKWKHKQKHTHRLFPKIGLGQVTK